MPSMLRAAEKKAGVVAVVNGIEIPVDDFYSELNRAQRNCCGHRKAPHLSTDYQAQDRGGRRVGETGTALSGKQKEGPGQRGGDK